MASEFDKALGVDVNYLITGERSDEASALDVVRDEEEATLLTTFRHIPGETREVAQRTLAAMAEKKPPAVALKSSLYSWPRKRLFDGNNQLTPLGGLIAVETITNRDALHLEPLKHCTHLGNIINCSDLIKL